jgi:hypothetical protein
MMVQAARAEAIHPDQISFKGALQTFNAFLPHLLHARTPDEATRRWAAMLTAIGQHRVGNRPDRYEPRAVKRRRKKYPKLSIPREEAKQRLRKGETFDGQKG